MKLCEIDCQDTVTMERSKIHLATLTGRCSQLSKLLPYLARFSFSVRLLHTGHMVAVVRLVYGSMWKSDVAKGDSGRKYMF